MTILGSHCTHRRKRHALQAVFCCRVLFGCPEVSLFFEFFFLFFLLAPNSWSSSFVGCSSWGSALVSTWTSDASEAA